MTEPTRALTVRPMLTPSTWALIQALAPVMWKSRLFGVHSTEEAAAIMLKGFELGLGLTASFEFVQVVIGRPALSPRGCLALIHGASHLIEVKIEESTAATCTVWMRRKDTSFEFRRTWTIQDAQRAGVVKPDSGWASYPANMLLWRTVGFVADVVCPDLIGGLKRADELGAEIDREGNIVEGAWSTQLAETPEPTAAMPSAPTVQDLLDEGFSPEQILRFSGGVIPTDPQIVTEVASVLRARARAGIEAPGDPNPDDPMGVQAMAAGGAAERASDVQP